MLKRVTRLSLLTLVLVATFATGILFAQRTHPPVANAAGKAILLVIPVITSQAPEVDAMGQKTDSTITTTKRILVFFTDNTSREYNVQPDGHFRNPGFSDNTFTP